MGAIKSVHPGIKLASASSHLGPHSGMDEQPGKAIFFFAASEDPPGTRVAVKGHLLGGLSTTHSPAVRQGTGRGYVRVFVQASRHGVII